jgi:predicted nucleic acid-binding protein
MRTVYVETSVWGMVPPDQNPTLRRPTLEFLRRCENRLILPHISTIVTNEILDAPEKSREAIAKQLDVVDPVLLTVSPEAQMLARRFIAEGILPKRRFDDAQHVACALFNELDALVSWNYRHIANVTKAAAFNAVAALAGIRGRLEIHTPLEVLEWK